MAESRITPRDQDFATWYQDVVIQGDMAEPAEIVKGCMVIKPNGYAVWETLQRELDQRFKASGHQNVYFPLLIPESFLKKEAEHVEGFSPELAVVTIAGGKELEEPYVIRPTSETIIGHFFAASSCKAPIRRRSCSTWCCCPNSSIRRRRSFHRSRSSA